MQPVLQVKCPSLLTDYEQTSIYCWLWCCDLHLDFQENPLNATPNTARKVPLFFKETALHYLPITTKLPYNMGQGRRSEISGKSVDWNSREGTLLSKCAYIRIDRGKSSMCRSWAQRSKL